MTEPEPLQQVDRTYVRVRGRRLSYFSGCDYFRLSSHPRIIAAVESGMKRYGLNVAASRMTTGNHVLYKALERALADFFQADNALVVSSGYTTNLVLAQGLAGNFSHALLDEHAHPALVDAASFLDCPVLRFRHADPAAVADAVRRCGPQSKLLLLTDGMFARDGSVAPLADYLAVLPPDAILLVDDAHGAGILGANGRGSLEYIGVNRLRIIQTITLSKAFGAYGGAILCSLRLREQILKRSRLFIGTTPLPLPLANAALAAVKLVERDKSFRQRLKANTNYVRCALHVAGFPVEDTPGPIVAFVPHRAGEIRTLKTALLSAGIYPPLIKYPGGPPAGLLRFVISSEHTQRQLKLLLKTLLPLAALLSAAGWTSR